MFGGICSRLLSREGKLAILSVETTKTETERERKTALKKGFLVCDVFIVCCSLITNSIVKKGIISSHNIQYCHAIGYID